MGDGGGVSVTVTDFLSGVFSGSWWVPAVSFWLPVQLGWNLPVVVFMPCQHIELAVFTDKDHTFPLCSCFSVDHCMLYLSNATNTDRLHKYQYSYFRHRQVCLCVCVCVCVCVSYSSDVCGRSWHHACGCVWWVSPELMQMWAWSARGSWQASVRTPPSWCAASPSGGLIRYEHMPCVTPLLSCSRVPVSRPALCQQVPDCSWAAECMYFSRPSGFSFISWVEPLLRGRER